MRDRHRHKGRERDTGRQRTVEFKLCVCEPFPTVMYLFLGVMPVWCIGTIDFNTVGFMGYFGFGC